MLFDVRMEFLSEFREHHVHLRRVGLRQPPSHTNSLMRSSWLGGTVDDAKPNAR
jgi:hypothetical protein